MPPLRVLANDTDKMVARPVQGADLADSAAVVLAEIGNRLVIGNYAAREPHHLTLRPASRSSRRLDWTLAIRMAWTALPITSRGRALVFGALGIFFALVCCLAPST